MRIGIDGYNLALPHGTGVASYGRALAEAVRALGHSPEGVFGIDVGDDPALREILFFDRLARTDRVVPPRGMRWVIDALRNRRGASACEVPVAGTVEQGAFADRLPAFDRIHSSADLFGRAHRHFRRSGRFLDLRMADPPAIMHWTYPVPITLAGARNIYTLHDLVPLRLPHTTLDNKPFYHRLIARCVAQADHICTDSEASRADILGLFDAPPDRVTNTYLAAPTPGGALADDPMEDAAAIAGMFGLAHRTYFLYFGAIEPRKNIGRLIQAYLSLGTETGLVLVGGQRGGGDDAALPGGDADGPLAGRITRLNYLPRAILLQMIRGARAVVFPSLSEGFGLPVLEAMQLGTPVLTSDRSSMAEVAGDAALLVDPYSTASIAGGLRTLDADRDLRARLGQAGRVRAEAFSEARFRERLQQLYGTVAAAAR